MNALASAFDAELCTPLEIGGIMPLDRNWSSLASQVDGGAAGRRPPQGADPPCDAVIIRVADLPDTLLTWQQPGQIDVQTTVTTIGPRTGRATRWTHTGSTWNARVSGSLAARSPLIASLPVTIALPDVACAALPDLDGGRSGAGCRRCGRRAVRRAALACFIVLLAASPAGFAHGERFADPPSTRAVVGVDLGGSSVFDRSRTTVGGEQSDPDLARPHGRGRIPRGHSLVARGFAAAWRSGRMAMPSKPDTSTGVWTWAWRRASISFAGRDARRRQRSISRSRSASAGPSSRCRNGAPSASRSTAPGDGTRAARSTRRRCSTSGGGASAPSLGVRVGIGYVRHASHRRTTFTPTDPAQARIVENADVVDHDVLITAAS